MAQQCVILHQNLFKMQGLSALLILDALFLVAYFLNVGCQQQKPYDIKPSFNEGTHFVQAYKAPIWFDVYLLENQITLG